MKSRNNDNTYEAKVERIKQAMDFDDDDLATYVTTSHDIVHQCSRCGDVHMCVSS